MPFPATYESLIAAGYSILRAEVCPDCYEGVEVFLSPAKREMIFQPMYQLLSPVVPHSHVCKPKDKLPATRGSLYAAGWVFQGIVSCYECKRAVTKCEKDGELVYFDPMLDDLWPVSLHNCKGVQSRTSPTFPQGGSEAPPEVQNPVLEAPEGKKLHFYGVTDPNHNLIAVAYEPVDGVLHLKFSKGEGIHRNVPEDLYMKLRSSRFALRQYTLTIKGKPEYPYTKVA